MDKGNKRLVIKLFSSLAPKADWVYSSKKDCASIMYASNLYVSQSVKTPDCCFEEKFYALCSTSCASCNTRVSKMTSGLVYTAFNKRHMKCYLEMPFRL